jgi:hypothetical protein
MLCGAESYKHFNYGNRSPCSLQTLWRTDIKGPHKPFRGVDWISAINVVGRCGEPKRFGRLKFLPLSQFNFLLYPCTANALEFFSLPVDYKCKEEWPHLQVLLFGQ